MNWEQKLQAMKALCGDFSVCLMMRCPGNWYVSARGRECYDGVILRGNYGNGRTPAEAVENDWRECVEELPSDQCLMINYKQPNQRKVRWNGYMWADV